VIDAAGAIYVIGGYDGRDYPNKEFFQDVWATTDGGATPDSVQGGTSGGTRGGTWGVTRGDTPGVLRGT
jgi:hypothetical protein